MRPFYEEILQSITRVTTLFSSTCTVETNRNNIPGGLEDSTTAEIIVQQGGKNEGKTDEIVEAQF